MFIHLIVPQDMICFSLASFFFNTHMLRENDWNYL